MIEERDINRPSDYTATRLVSTNQRGKGLGVPLNHKGRQKLVFLVQYSLRKDADVSTEEVKPCGPQKGRSSYSNLQVNAFSRCRRICSVGKYECYVLILPHCPCHRN